MKTEQPWSNLEQKIKDKNMKKINKALEQRWKKYKNVNPITKQEIKKAIRAMRTEINTNDRLN